MRSVKARHLGEKLKLDGEVVATLIPAIASARSLMIAVDDWVDQN
jgi:hypothetical protein